MRVPAIAATVTTESCLKGLPVLALHTKEVDETQDVVWQAPPLRLAVAVCSLYPKFIPSSVIDAPPLSGPFLDTTDTTGASNDSSPCIVPTTAEIVTANDIAALDSCPDRQRSCVCEVHCAV